MAQLITVRLSRPDIHQPWGLRLQGGKDFGTPLVVQKVNMGSVADQAGLLAGDALVKVNNLDVFNLRHKDAQDVIVRAGNSFEVVVQRGANTWRPAVTPTGMVPSPTPNYTSTHVNTVTKTSLAHKQQETKHIGSGYNNAARPFGSVNGCEPVKSIVNKQYNTPVGIYSEESIAETLSAQAEVLAGGVLGVNFKKNEKVYNSAGSEVLKALQESENEPNEPANKNYFWTASHTVGSAASSRTATPAFLQKLQDDEKMGTALQQNRLAPDAAHRPSLPADAQQQVEGGQSVTDGKGGQCDDCGATITGVFVRIKDKNLHVDCFRCATCGTSLKNQGYFNLNNKLYCDIHAKLAAMNNPPPGTEGYKPVPIQPSTKLSANTISAALDAHYNGTANNHDILPNHSRTSSSASSVGSSYVSSTDSNKASPSKTSPAHSRQSSFGCSNGSSSSSNYKLEENDKNAINSAYLNPVGSLPHYQQKLNAQIREHYNQKHKIGNGNHSSNGSNNSNEDVNGNGHTNGMNGNGQCEIIAPDEKDSSMVTESIYGTIRPHTKIKLSDEFTYKTLGGDVIRSVHPPGKGNTSYKLNSNLAGPKPFAYGSGPPPAGPKSPSSYPPPSQMASWAKPTPPQSYSQPPPPQSYSQPPQPNYGSNTLPRSFGQSAPGRFTAQKPGYRYSQAAPPLPLSPPPPPPPPTQTIQKPIAKETIIPDSNNGYKPGYATELLEQSLLKLKASEKEEFRTNAGKVISLMLESRLNDKDLKPKDFPLQSQAEIADTINDQSKKILFASIPADSPLKMNKINKTANGNGSIKNTLPPPPPPPLLHQKPPQLNGSNGTTEIAVPTSPPPPPPPPTPLHENPLPNFNQILIDNNIVPPKTPAPDVEFPPPPSPVAQSHAENGRNSVIFRNKDNQSKLSTHARDRRSYIEKDTKINGGDDSQLGSNTTNKASELTDGKQPVCNCCNMKITRGPFITALGRIWCPDHFVCVTSNCRRPLQDIGFVEEKGDLYCEYCFEKYLAPPCDKCGAKIKGDCLNAIGKHFHPECFNCAYCGKLFGNSPFFLEEGQPYCEADWNEMFTTKCFACGFPVEAGDRWVEALSHNYHSQCFNCTTCKKNLEGQSFFAKGGRPFCKNHAR